MNSRGFACSLAVVTFNSSISVPHFEADHQRLERLCCTASHGSGARKPATLQTSSHMVLAPTMELAEANFLGKIWRFALKIRPILSTGQTLQ